MTSRANGAVRQRHWSNSSGLRRARGGGAFALVGGVCLSLLLSQAWADELDKATALYHRGKFAEAAKLGRAAGSADGFALAAKGTLVDAVHLAPLEKKSDLLQVAIGDARRALALDPEHVEARLQLAIALGNLAELRDPIQAHLDGFAKRGKELIDQALRLDPDNRWARALLGIWHLRIVERAGAGLGQQLYGASREAGLDYCSEALSDRVAALKYGCAVAMLELDGAEFAEVAEQTLTAIGATPARDAAERLVQSDAGRLLEALKADPPPADRGVGESGAAPQGGALRD